ncbi:MAG TPA: amidase [Acidimicrobiales bacterium]|nr:amidase [Acidimicrobiales bacterium]
MVGQDNWGALVVGPEVMLEGRRAGPLHGLDFVVKDVFDVAGYKTGAGNPEYLAAHPAATVTAPAVTKLVDAGARLVGKAVTDEFTWSLAGTNPHYGTPRNPRDSERFPGGSSSGSAVAVASGLVPFALGTDTAGSVRVPASYCGVFGMRPTHGRVDNSGVVPLAPSYDTVGWFARDGSLLRDVGTVLLTPGADHAPAHEIVILSDAFLLADDDVRDVLLEAVEALAARAELRVTRHHFSDEGVRGWQAMAEAYPNLMAPEAWAAHGAWLTEAKPTLGRGVGARFAMAANATEEGARAVRPVRDAAAARHAELCRHGAILAVPAAPSVAPRLDMPIDELPALRARTLAVGIVPTLVGAPSVSVPIARIGDLPVNLALIGAHGSDETLLELVADLA